MSIDMEATLDEALEVRVEAALLGHRWAQLVQPHHFQESQAQLDTAQADLEAAQATQRQCIELAQRHGWM